MDYSDILRAVLSNIPQDVALEFSLPDISGLIPTQVELLSMLKFLGLLALGSLCLGVIGRLFFGKRSGSNHALSSTMGILFVYVISIVIYTFRPMQLDQFLSPLPFSVFTGEYFCLFSFHTAPLSVICYEILAALILSFLVNLIDTFLPQGNGVIGWFAWRILTVVLAMAAHLLVRWAISSFLPDVLVSYTPMILLGLLAAMILLSAAKVVLSLVLTAVDPILGAVYAFFFSNIVGKQIIKAVFSTAVLCALVYLLDFWGCGIIAIGMSALIAYIPLLVILLVLWYVLGHIL